MQQDVQEEFNTLVRPALFNYLLLMGLVSKDFEDDADSAIVAGGVLGLRLTFSSTGSFIINDCEYDFTTGALMVTASAVADFPEDFSLIADFKPRPTSLRVVLSEKPSNWLIHEMIEYSRMPEITLAVDGAEKLFRNRDLRAYYEFFLVKKETKLSRDLLDVLLDMICGGEIT